MNFLIFSTITPIQMIVALFKWPKLTLLHIHLMNGHHIAVKSTVITGGRPK